MPRVPLDALDGKYPAFHLSGRSDIEVLEPRIPRLRFMDVDGFEIEDSVTPRVCFGPTVEECAQALGYGHDCYIYVPVDSTELTDPMSKANPPDGFGPDFTWEVFLRNSGIETYDQGLALSKQLLQFCVPDLDETGELWALTPVKVRCVGKIVEINYTSRERFVGAIEIETL